MDRTKKHQLPTDEEIEESVREEITIMREGLAESGGPDEERDVDETRTRMDVKLSKTA